MNAIGKTSPLRLDCQSIAVVGAQMCADGARLVAHHALFYFRYGCSRSKQTQDLSPERIEAMFRKGIAWVLPNIALGSLIIVPVWFLAYILRPPGPTRE